MDKREIKSMCAVILQQQDISSQSDESWILREQTNKAVSIKLEATTYTESKVGQTCSVKCQEHYHHFPFYCDGGHTTLIHLPKTNSKYAVLCICSTVTIGKYPPKSVLGILRR